LNLLFATVMITGTGDEWWFSKFQMPKRDQYRCSNYILMDCINIWPIYNYPSDGGLHF